MTQILVSLKLTDAQLTAVDAALTEIETQLAGLIAMPTQQKRGLKKMGRKSEAFCRQALRVLEQNPQMVPANVPLADAVANLESLEQLRPRMVRLARLSERAYDTDIALGSDVMGVALQGYSLMKLTGRTEGIEGLRQALGGRFAKSSRQTPPPSQSQPETKAA